MGRLWPQRIYVPGTGIQWCIWRWSAAQEPYLYRLFLVKTPLFAVCLHWIMQPDDGDPHDHTATLLSFMLRGWYDEYRKTPGRDWHYVRRRRCNYIRGSRQDTHRIVAVSPGGCLTLGLLGRKVREWGYHTRLGWVHHASYEGGGH